MVKLALQTVRVLFVLLIVRAILCSEAHVTPWFQLTNHCAEIKQSEVVFSRIVVRDKSFCKFPLIRFRCWPGFAEHSIVDPDDISIENW
jgi:hypothetical protein